MASRQTDDLGEDSESDEEDSEEEGEGEGEGEDRSTNEVKDDPRSDAESLRTSDQEILSLPRIPSISADTIPCAGFNGRCNKVADTCYSFWNGATLMMLNRYSVVDDVRNRRYLLDKTQHLVGGFGKVPGDAPDLLHSCFGLISLAFQGEAGLARVDPALVTTERVVRHLESLPWHNS